MGPVSLRRIEAALASGEFAGDPHAWYDRLRDTAPVYWSPSLQQWLVTSYELVERVLLAPGDFSNFGFNREFISRLPVAVYDEVDTLRHFFSQQGLIQTDPPKHTELRRLVGPFFSAEALSALEAAISQRVADLLSKALDDGDGIDVVADFAKPLSVGVLADLLGVPDDDRRRFPDWSADVIRFFGTPAPMASHARALDKSLVEWRAMVLDLFGARLTHPRDGFLTEIARLVDSSAMTTEEGLSTSIHLLIAGHETTTALIANTVYCLLGHRAQFDRVRESPELVFNAIEETLRFEPSITRIRRLAVIDTELGGMEIPAGAAVGAVVSAANRDPTRFTAPGEYLIDRDFTSVPHLSFGRGRHFCLGVNLARLEAPYAINGFLKRFPAARLPVDYTPSWHDSIHHRSLKSLPVEGTLALSTEVMGS